MLDLKQFNNPSVGPHDTPPISDQGRAGDDGNLPFGISFRSFTRPMQGRALSLSRQRGFASPAQLLSFLAVNQTQIVTWITTSGYQAAPILRRCLTRGLPECTGEIGLTRKPEREGDIGQGPIRIGEQVLGALQTPCADMPMRRLADGGLEGTREMELAQAGN